jgi:hypothetical protein
VPLSQANFVLLGLLLIPKTGTYQKKQKLARMKIKPQINAAAVAPDNGVSGEVLAVALYGGEDCEGLAGAPNLTNNPALSPWSW